MAWPSLYARSKDWGNEILTDTDLEGALDLIGDYINDMMNSSTGHKHDGTTAEGPALTTLGAVTTNGIFSATNPINWKKGADVASATTTDIGAATGNYIDVTGTTTITGLGTIQAGTFRIVRFTGALTLTHNATSLMLPTEANITTVAGDTAGLVSLGSGNWKCVFYDRYDGTSLTAFNSSNAPDGTVLQVVNTQTGAVATGTTLMPSDDTILQNTEGDEYMSLAITPTSTTNKLRIDVVFNGAASTNNNPIMALFQDSTANALATTAHRFPQVNTLEQIVLTHYMTAGTTSATTFKVRVGGGSGTITFNGVGGVRQYGGTMASSITITEIKAS